MARIFIDGFEAGEHDMWDGNSGATVETSAGRDMDGDYCLDLASATDYIQKNITANDEMYFAFLWRTHSLATSNGLMHVLSDANIMILIRRNFSTGVIDVFRGATNIVSGTKTFVVNTTYLIEIWIKIADSGGRVKLKVDGVTDIDFTGDTKNSSYAQFNRVKLGRDTVGRGNGNAHFDNFIMDDAAWIGDTKIQAILPTGAGNTTGWTPSAGNNWACVDERPPSDVDYVSINANDQVDTYQAGNMAGSIDSVKCVQIQSRTESDGTPTPTNLKLVVRSGGTDYLSGDKSVPAAPKGLWNLWENNPADSLAWEEADINAMEIGIKSAA